MRRKFGRHHRGKWLQIKAIHHRLVGVMVLAVALGAVGGFGLHLVLESGRSAWGLGCCLISAWIAAGPLAWIASVRIAGPVRELARVAGELRDGHLEVRRELHGDGEVGEVADALRGMADRVVDQLHAQRALMAAVSHELRSPLGRVRVLTELLREGGAPPSAYDDVQREIDGMDALVGDLLAAARIDFEAVAPRDLDVVDLAMRAASQAGLPDDQVSFTGAPGEVRVDATLVSRALLGLLDNARRYGGRQITLAVADLGDRVQFTVEDDGPGFAPGDEQRAFEPFWRGPAAAHAPPGEGLGLALVRQIARAHGGEAGARTREGGGARVWIVLPRRR